MMDKNILVSNNLLLCSQRNPVRRHMFQTTGYTPRNFNLGVLKQEMIKLNIAHVLGI